MLLVFSDQTPVSPTRPLRFGTPPGPALLRQNLPWLQVISDPLRAEVRRIGLTNSLPTYALFDLCSMPQAISSVRQLRNGTSLVAVRGRMVPNDATDAFDELWVARRLLDLLGRDHPQQPLPRQWRHPSIVAETWRHGQRVERLAVVFSRLPEPGVLDVADFGRTCREGAPAASLHVPGEIEATLEPSAAALPALLTELARMGRQRVLLVDNGGDIDALASELASVGLLGGYLGTARRTVPEAARSVPMYLWFEAEDFRGPELQLPHAGEICAFVPVGLQGESPTDAADRVQLLRQRGITAVVPRFHIPVPATREWQTLAAQAPLRHQVNEPLDGSHPIFMLPGWSIADAPEQLASWRAGNRWPAPSASAPTAVPSYSLGGLRLVLDGYMRHARTNSSDCHSRDLIVEFLRDLGTANLELHPTYPFLAWRGESMLHLVNRAIEVRLASVTATPETLFQAIRHTALAGGKRIRPILALGVAAAHGVELDAALPAALALEWLHTASLVQDDLPCMDDDPVRRRTASAHVRHGEGVALLASDALVAMAFEDLAGLASHRNVGGGRASELVAAVARELGATGIVGGQALDLMARERGVSDLRTLVETHRRKTAPLFRLAATAGAILSGLPAAERARLEDSLARLGLAFQIVDDLLDAGGRLGRPPGSDARERRMTFATVLKRERALHVAERLAGPFAGLGGKEPFRTAFARLADVVVTRTG